MNLEVEQINIILDTNIPGSKPISFTKELLYHPTLTNKSSFSTYPYFIIDVRIPREQLNKLNYGKRAEIFFNKKKFENMLVQYGLTEGYQKEMTSSEKNNIINYNVESILKLLLPTQYPIINNISTSFDTYIKKNVDTDITMRGALPGFMNNAIPGIQPQYSYLSIAGKKYTVSRVIWLNDILNHPKYNDLIDKFLSYMKWTKPTIKKIDKELLKLDEKLKKSIKKPVNYDKEINNIILRADRYKPSARPGALIIDTKNKEIYENLLELKEKIEILYDETVIEKDILNLLDSIIFLKKQLSSQYKMSESFDNNIMKIMNEAKQIKILQTIKEKYFQKDSINISYKEDESDIQKKLESNFSRYTEFVKTLQEFVSNNRESTNTYLQEMIDDYTKTTNVFFFIFIYYYINGHYFYDKSEEEILLSIKSNNANKKINSDLTSEMFYKIANDDNLYTGINIISTKSFNEPRLEINVLVDLIGGELNDTNLSKIKCFYQDENLGNMFEKLLKKHNGWLIDDDRFFITIDEIEKKIKDIEVKKKIELESVRKPVNKNKLPIKGKIGGTKKRKNNTRKSRTEKRYY